MVWFLKRNTIKNLMQLFMKIKQQLNSLNTFKFFLFACFFVFSIGNSYSQVRFWVGGTGNWNDPTHWSLTSGGVSGASVPLAADSAIFNALSSVGAYAVSTPSPSETIRSVNALGANSVSFSLNLTVTKSFFGPTALGSSFSIPTNTLSLTGTAASGNVFQANELIINSILRLTATTSPLNITSKFTALQKVFLVNGTLNFNGNNATVGSLLSYLPGTDTRVFNFSSSTFTIATDSLNLVSLSVASVRPRRVNFTMTGSAFLKDNLAAVSYDSLFFVSSKVNLFHNLNANYLNFDSDSLKLTNGTRLSFDTLVTNANCVSRLVVSNNITPALPKAEILYTGTNDSIPLNGLAFLNIVARDSLGFPKNYVNAFSKNAATVGVTLKTSPNTFYWIGNTGDWSDASHWSETSGGITACFVPKNNDTLIFDQNSFNLPNQTVTIDTALIVGKMTWANIDDSAKFVLGVNLISNGDILLDNKLTFLRDSIQYRLEFKKKATFNQDNAAFDCSVSINMTLDTDTLRLSSPIIASDSSSIVHLSGRFNTNNQNITAQSYIGRGLAQKRIFMGSSTIRLKDGWDTDSLNLNYQVVPGTSHIIIGRSLDSNYFINNNKTFYDLTLNYNPRKLGSVRGGLTCNDLTITAGSMVQFQAGRTVTMDSLIINGGCNKFKIDTLLSPDLEIDTISIDTLSALVTVYSGFSPTNVFGYSPIPKDSVSDTLFVINFDTGLNQDTIVTKRFITRAIHIDTLAGPSYQYLDSITEYKIEVTLQTDTVGYIELYSFGVDNDTLTGRQEVLLKSTINGTKFRFFSPKVQNVYGIRIQDGRFLGAGAKTAFFSTNVSGNDLWTFNTSTSTTADFDFLPSVCFGDTTFFVNNSTAFSGNQNDLTFVWDYDETVKLGDTSAYIFQNSGKHIVRLSSYYTNSCFNTFIDSITIYDPTLFATIDQPDLTICQGTSVEFTASAIDSLTIFQFYKNGISLGPISALDSILVGPLLDNDSISIRASLFGCLAEDTISYVFDVTPNPVVLLGSSDADTTICDGTSVTMTSSGANNYQFFLNGTSATGNLPVLSFIKTNLVNNDQVYVIGSNTTTSCKDTSGILDFTVNPLPTTTLIKSIASGTICAGTNVTFTAGGASTYEFFVSNVSQGAPSATTTFNTSTLTTGQIVKVIGYTTLGCQREALSTFSFVVTPLPVAGISVADIDTSICQGQNISFNATGGAIYEYFINNVSQGITGVSTFNSASLANNDQVKVKVAFSGCSDTSVFIPIEVRANPTTNLTSSDANDTICQLQSVTFTASGATNYSFSINGSLVQASSVDNDFVTSTLVNGSTILVIGESNNCFVNDQVIYTVLGIPNVNITSSDFDNTVCQGEPITFTGIGAATYQLSVDNVFGTVQALPTFPSTLSVGPHTVLIRGFAANGCSNLSSSTLNVTVNPNPTVSIVSNDLNDTICAGTAIQFTGSGSSFYQFYVNNVSQTSSTVNPNYTNSNLTNGQQVFVVGSSLGCIGRSDTLTIGVNPVPAVNLTSSDIDNAFCQAANETYTASGATQYQFFLNGVSQGAPSATTILNTAGISAGNYTVSVTGSSLGCSNSSALNIIINPIPTVTISSSDIDNQFCIGENVTLTGNGGANYEFILNGTSQGVSGPLTTFSSSAFANADAIYVIGTSAAGCVDSSLIQSFTVNAAPIVTNISSDLDNTICSGAFVTFTGSGATNYEFFLNGISQGAASPINVLTTNSLTNGQTILIKGSIGGCSSNSTGISTTVYIQPVVSLSNLGSTNLCSTDLPNIAANGAQQYQFFINAVPTGPFSVVSSFTSPVNNIDVLSVVGQSNGCVSNGLNTIGFTVTPTPTVTLLSSDADATICLDQSVTFTSSGASTYTFAVNGIPQQNGTSTTYITPDITNGDLVTVQGNNNQCVSTIQQITFVVNALDLAASSPSLICEGSPINITASGADLYEFFVNGTSQGAPSATNTFSSGGLTQGDVITLEGTNTLSGCVQDLGYGIIPTVVPNTTIIPVGSTTFCAGDSVVLTSNFSYGNQWYLNGLPILGATDSTYTATIAGNYSLEHIAGGNGEVWSKGYNGSGTLGDQTNLNSAALVAAANLTDIKNIETGYDFALALTNAGTVYSWGENGSGQLGNGTYTTTNEAALVPVLANITQIATTSSSCAALTSTGQVYVWGNNNNGQLGVGSNAIINFPFLLTSISNVSEIVAGKNHFIALRNDGTVWAVGNNSFGQLAQGDLVNSNVYEQITGLSSIVKIGSGENHSFAINGIGNLFAWGANIDGQLGLGDLTNRLTPVQLALQNVKNVTGGANHSLILTNLKDVYVVGSNTYGQLGDVSITQTSFPKKSAIGGVREMSAGEYSSLLLIEDGRVLSSGFNDDNQLQPTATNVTSFTQVIGMDGVNAIETGKRSIHAVFGNANSCANAATTVVVNTIVPPTITESSFTLSSSVSNFYQWYNSGLLIPGATQQNYAVFTTGNYVVEITDVNGCSAFSDTIYLFVASLDEKTNLDVNVYPNPSNGIFQLIGSAVNEIEQIEVLDVTGRIIQTYSEIDATNNNIDLTKEENGTYYLRILSKGESTIKRIMLVK